MDQAKTTQALKQIFDQCGTNIMQDRRRFEAYLEDLLPGSSCSTERLVLRHALDSSALTLLLRAPAFTEDAARRAVEQLRQESRMGAEDAEFVVRCVIAARGGDPNVLNAAVPEPPKPVPGPPKPTPPAPKPEPTPPAPKPEPPKPTPPAPKPEPPEPYIPPEPPKPPEPRELATIYSRMPVPGRFFNRNPQGNLYMYQDRMLFLPNKGKGQVEISYEEIYMLKPKGTTVFWLTLFMILIPCVAIFLFSEYVRMGSDELMLWGILITAYCLIIEFVVIYSYRHSLTLVMNYAISSSGNRYRPIHPIHIFAPADKKLAVSIIKSKMNSQP